MTTQRVTKLNTTRMNNGDHVIIKPGHPPILLARGLSDKQIERKKDRRAALVTSVLCGAASVGVWAYVYNWVEHSGAFGAATFAAMVPGVVSVVAFLEGFLEFNKA